MDALALLGLLGLLLVKEAGLPVPVPGDLLVIGAGAAVMGVPLVGLTVLAAILAVGYVGGSVQFLLARGALRRVLLDLLVRIGVPRTRLDSLADWLQRRGAGGVAVARATPGLRVGAIAAAGLAALGLPTFLAGLVVGNAVFVGGHFALGFLVGPAAVGLVAGGGSVAVLVVVIGALAAFGAVGWSMLRRRRAPTGMPAAPTPEGTGSAYGAWADAACPACLAIALVRSGEVPGV